MKKTKLNRVKAPYSRLDALNRRPLDGDPFSLEDTQRLARAPHTIRVAGEQVLHLFSEGHEVGVGRAGAVEGVSTALSVVGVVRAYLIGEAKVAQLGHRHGAC